MLQAGNIGYVSDIPTRWLDSTGKFEAGVETLKKFAKAEASIPAGLEGIRVVELVT